MKWLKRRKTKRSDLSQETSLKGQNLESLKPPEAPQEISNEKYQLFINGRDHENRGLDLACNPYNGTVLGDVVLVSQSLLEEEAHEEDHTVALFHRTKQ
ncbi:MAG: hypothetical protein H7A32_03270 [Deltaproteobacteria bacterium]|nr:hypothetical protein [Deltaproteobacteria bacterium]